MNVQSNRSSVKLCQRFTVSLDFLPLFYAKNEKQNVFFGSNDKKVFEKHKKIFSEFIDNIFDVKYEKKTEK